MTTRVPARRYDTVQQDWRAILPFAKGSLFSDHTGELESAYLMMSVSLNEAIGLSRTGKLSQASQEMEVLAQLCARLALRINAVLHAMRQHGRHFGIVPNLAPLKAVNFHSARGQRAARHSNLLDHVLLSERSQFLNKIDSLEEIVDDLSDEFIANAQGLAAGFSSNAAALWRVLDVNHFDLNTCLRETDVLLKSFLCVLPEEQLARFDFTACGLARARRPVKVSTGLVRTRRIAAIAGE
ncbi:MAG TPA: hypothetical protein VIW23_18030 [Candidatus Acidoferrum sp.]